MAIIDSRSVVGISYTLKGDDGMLLDQSSEEAPFVFLTGVQGIVPGLERELMGKTSGASFSASLPPKEAYGELDPQLLGEVSRSQFPEDQEVKEGMRFQAEVSGGLRLFTVRKLEGDRVTIDANHELAGKTLHFEGKVVSVRAATDEEISHKHVHSCSGGGCCGEC